MFLWKKEWDCGIWKHFILKDNWESAVKARGDKAGDSDEVDSVNPKRGCKWCASRKEKEHVASRRCWVINTRLQILTKMSSIFIWKNDTWINGAAHVWPFGFNCLWRHFKRYLFRNKSWRISDKLCKCQTAEKCEMLLAYHRDFLCQGLWGRRPHECTKSEQVSSPGKQGVCLGD